MLGRLLNSNAFFLAVEAGGLLLAAMLYAVLPKLTWMTYLQFAFVKLAENRLAAISTSMLLAVAGRLLLLPIFPVPVPGVHDEFSYLLSGATFASGHLANPTSPVWQSFETFHTLQQPSYVSMYPVAPGAFLAVGFLLGTPWAGVLIPVALLCGAITWALQGIVPCRWALLGGLLAVFKFGLVSYWVDSYWGGAVPALGGAIVMGCAVRLLRRKRVGDAILLSLGILLLANSRPFEGAVFLSAVVGWSLFQVSHRLEPQDARQLIKLAVPAGGLLFAGALLMGWYFKAATNDPFTMPYVKYAEEYSITRPFLWDRLRPKPIFHNAVMRRYYEREIPLYARAHTFAGWASEVFRKLSAFAMFYLWPGVLLVVITLPRIVRTSEGRFALLLITAVLAGISFEIWPMMLHYPSPAAAAAVLLLVCAIRECRRFVSRGYAVGIGLSFAVPALCMGGMSLRVIAAAQNTWVPDHGLVSYLTVAPGNLARQGIVAFLSRKPHNQLVIVRYSATHDLSNEWVYNDPSIDQSKIIWARELDFRTNEKLIQHFRTRHVWLLQPDENPPLLTPYGPSSLKPAAAQ